MKHIQKQQLYVKQNDLTDILFDEKSIFFDIETTGFSPTNSNIYLIGCLYKKGTFLFIEQFFAESKDDEKELLENFISILNQYRTIISFNGTGFDIPFIKAKCNAYQIPEKLNKFQNIDIFKQISNIKFLLKLPNYKQKTIENFLEIHRDDKYSGGELINVYNEYIHTKSHEAESLLLLHNFDDVTGMLDLIPILSYTEILNGQYSIISTEISPYTSFEGETNYEMIITLKNNYFLPKRVSYQYLDYYLTMNKEESRIRIPLFKGELRYFYSNFKDYFYLPEEDIAIHKSVATFVDKAYRERAKACNCYNRKSGTFLPQYDSIMNPVFHKQHKDKCSYFELTEDFSTSNVMLQRYVDHIFKLFMQTKGKDRI